MLAIRNNLMAEGAARHLGNSYDKLATSVERLSSGLRINSAKDDAAGLAVRELIRADVAALKQGSRNASDGVSMLQAAEGALGQVDEILIRMRELAEQAATGTYSNAQKTTMQEEFDELSSEITRIAETTDFNDINLLNGTGSVKISLGKGVDTTGETISVDKQNITATSLGVNAATRAQLQSAYHVSNKTDAYLIGTAATDNLNIQLGSGGAADTINYVVGANTKSLEDVVTDINALTNLKHSGWEAASAVYNTTDSGWELKLTAYESGTMAATDLQLTTNGDVEWGDDTTDVAEDASGFVQSGGTAGIDLSDGADTAIDAVETAISTKDTYRAKLGYWMNRMEYASSVLDVQAENLLAAESRISDVDIATEMSSMTRQQVLSQAGVSMLAQANSMPQMALKLLG